MSIKTKLRMSAAAVELPQQDCAERSAGLCDPSSEDHAAPEREQRYTDPDVAARHRGALVDKATSKAPATKPGRTQLPRGPPIPIGAYSITTFCIGHTISEFYFHKLMAQGRGPEVMRIGKRTLISVEAAARWRAEQEAATRNQNPDEQAPSPAV